MARLVASASVSQRRVDPSMSVKRNVTVPEGRATGGHYARAARGHSRRSPAGRRNRNEGDERLDPGTYRCGAHSPSD
jgi:hypothetical protein